MPKFDLNDAQIADIAAFIHSFKVGGYDISRMTPPSIVVGDAKAGEAYFKAQLRVVPLGDRRPEGFRRRKSPTPSSCSKPG